MKDREIFVTDVFDAAEYARMLFSNSQRKIIRLGKFDARIDGYFEAVISAVDFSTDLVHNHGDCAPVGLIRIRTQNSAVRLRSR